MKLKRKSKTKITLGEPLFFPDEILEYYIRLSVGSPAQDLWLVVDTGNDLVWVYLHQK